jgi:hypothetical protein
MYCQYHNKGNYGAVVSYHISYTFQLHTPSEKTVLKKAFVKILAHSITVRRKRIKSYRTHAVRPYEISFPLKSQNRLFDLRKIWQ